MYEGGGGHYHRKGEREGMEGGGARRGGVLLLRVGEGVVWADMLRLGCHDDCVDMDALPSQTSENTGENLCSDGNTKQ